VDLDLAPERPIVFRINRRLLYDKIEEHKIEE